MPTIQLQELTSAPPEAIWGLLADVTTWPRWGPWEQAELVAVGMHEPAGVGAVRRLRTRTLTSLEQVVRFEPCRALGYVLKGGLPLTAYRADVTLVRLGEQTVVQWHSRFGGPYAWFFVPGLKHFLRSVLRDLVAAAEAGAA